MSLPLIKNALKSCYIELLVQRLWRWCGGARLILGDTGLQPTVTDLLKNWEEYS